MKKCKFLKDEIKRLGHFICNVKVRTNLERIKASTEYLENKRMISVFSKKLDQAQKKYSINDRELLAIVKACDYFDIIY